MNCEVRNPTVRDCRGARDRTRRGGDAMVIFTAWVLIVAMVYFGTVLIVRARRLTRANGETPEVTKRRLIAPWLKL